MCEEIEQKKRWLYRYRNNQRNIERLANKLKRLDIKIKSLHSPIYSDMPKGTSRTDSTDLIADKEELEQRIERLKERGRIYRKEILEAIDELENEKYVNVLELWFIDGLSADEIGEKLNYSTRYIFTLYSKALENVLPQGVG